MIKKKNDITLLIRTLLSLLLSTAKILDRVAAIVGYNFCTANEWWTKRS